MVKIPKLKRWQKIILLIVVVLVLFMIVRRKPEGAKLEVAVVGRSTLSESVAASTGAYTSYLTANTNLVNNGYEREATKAEVEAKRLIRDQAQEDYNADDGDDNKQ